MTARELYYQREQECQRATQAEQLMATQQPQLEQERQWAEQEHRWAEGLAGQLKSLRMGSS